jgi:ABC-2 type transport system ATP-binding protein
VSETLIQTKGLTHDFGTVRAVDNLSLEVPSGTIFGFLGPNGAGKTTTIHLLLGLLEPTRGTARVMGFDTATQSNEIRSRSGALLEHHGLYEQLTAEENLEIYTKIWRMNPKKGRARILELLTRMELWDRRKDRVGTWSRGMKQKLALARVLLHRPKLAFLDEPTAGLDVMAANVVRDELESLAGRGEITIFLTTHNMAEVERLCSLVGVIRDGTLVTVGHPDKLRAQGGGKVLVLGSGFHEALLKKLQEQPAVSAAEIQNGRLAIDLVEEQDIAPLVNLIVQAGGKVEEIRRGKASLEEVFLTLMQEEDKEA